MGFRDHEFPDVFTVFSNLEMEAMDGDNERLHQLVKENQGRPLFRADQLDAFYQDMDIEPQLKLEYDRFLPGLNRHVD